MAGFGIVGMEACAGAEGGGGAGVGSLPAPGTLAAEIIRVNSPGAESGEGGATCGARAVTSLCGALLTSSESFSIKRVTLFESLLTSAGDGENDGATGSEGRVAKFSF